MFSSSDDLLAYVKNEKVEFVDIRFAQMRRPFLADGQTLRAHVGPELEDALQNGVQVLDAIRPSDLCDRLAGLLDDQHRRSTEVRIEPATYLGHYLSTSARSTRYEGGSKPPEQPATAQAGLSPTPAAARDTPHSAHEDQLRLPKELHDRHGQDAYTRLQLEVRQQSLHDV